MSEPSKCLNGGVRRDTNRLIICRCTRSASHVLTGFVHRDDTSPDSSEKGYADVKDRHGVYFEADFALGLSLPVIWTCRKEHIDDAHFDIDYFQHIVWTSAQELRDRLVNRITWTIGQGPLKAKQ